MSRVEGSAANHLASLLREHRRRGALTQEALAEAAGLSVRTVRNAESGQGRPPQPRSLRRLADALRLDQAGFAELMEAAAAATRRPSRPGPAARSDPPPARPPGERLFGRESDIDGIAGILLARPCLVSIVGLAGIGKTSVAAAVTARIAERFPGGVVWVELRSRREPPAIARAVAEAAHQPDLASFVADRGGRETLLVLDAIEFAEEVAAGLAELRAACPAHILVTGRRPVRAPDEYQWILGPLAVPAAEIKDAATLSRIPAVEMFVDRLLLLRPDYRLTDEDGPAVAALTRVLEGLPLALELAAGRGRVQSPADLLADYRSRKLDLTSPGAGGAKLREALAASWSLLSSADQQRLGELALLVRSWSLELARDYLGAGDEVDAFVDRVSAMGLVRTFVDRGSFRFHIADSVREFGLERLGCRGGLPDARERHARAVLTWAYDQARKITGPDQTEALRTLDELSGDIDEALAWAMERGDGTGLRTAAALGRYWRVRGRTVEGIVWIEQLLAGAGPPDTAYARLEAARLLSEIGQLDRSQQHLGPAAAQYREAGDEDGELDVLILLTRVLREQGRLQEGMDCAVAAAELARRHGDERRQRVAENNLYFDDVRLGRFEVAAERLERLLSAPGARWDPRSYGLVRMNQADAYYLAGRTEDSRTVLEKTVALLRDTGDRVRLAKSLSRLAICETELGRLEQATARLAEAGDAADAAEGLAYPWLALSTGILAARRGDCRGARRELRAALNGFTVLGQLREQIETLLRLAMVAAEPREAHVLVEQAARLATEKEIHLSPRENSLLTLAQLSA